MRARIKNVLRPYGLALRRYRNDPPRLASIGYARPRSFSQFGEDWFLTRYFDRTASGFYVDVGAFHPFSYSNTYRLYERGWRGINLEPNPEYLSLFRKYRPRDINLSVAVSDVPGDVTFALSGTFGGIVDDSYPWAQSAGERVTVQAVPLAEVLEEHLPPGVRFDLLDVDCEGHDLKVLRSNDWDKFRPTLVLAEEHNFEHPLVDYMRTRGYRVIANLDLTVVLEDESAGDAGDDRG